MPKQEDTILLIRKMIAENNEEPNWPEIGKAIGRSAEAARSYYRRHSEKYVSDYSEKNSVQINEDGTQVSDRLVLICEEERKDPRRLLELHNYDPDKWVVIESTDNLWHMQSGNEDGSNALLYQSKIRVKPNTELSLEIVERWFDEFNDGVRAKPSKPKGYSNDGDVLEINLADLHKGKRVPYDRHDLGENIRYTVSDIINRTAGKKFSKIILVLNGDTFHFDGKSRMTTSGTKLETDGSTALEIYDDVISMLIWIIDSLAEIAPVDIIVIPGNHDWFVSYTLARSLDLFYKLDNNVIVDTSHRPRKWRIIGCTLVGWMHGEMSKTNATGWLMSEAREEWGKTIYAEVHAGHWHSQQTIEKNGMVLRYLPSMTGTDEWHYDKGYVGSVRATVSFVWGLSEGLKEMWYTNILTS